MINAETIKQFPHEWITSWNNRDLESILSHYADSLEFRSPFVALLKFSESGIITNKTDLKKYFEIGLTTYPDLNFKLQDFFTGVNSVVIHYLSVNEIYAAEVFVLNPSGKAVKVYCNYSNPKIT